MNRNHIRPVARPAVRFAMWVYRREGWGEMTEKKRRMRWKMEPSETGLRAVGAGPRSYLYHDGETQYASVSPLGGGWRGPVKGWYWVAGWGSSIPHKNTCDRPCATPEEAKSQAAEYVRSHMAKVDP